MGPTKIERMDDRLDAIETALTAALPARTIKRGLYDYEEHTDAEIAAGVVMILSGGEGKYRQGPGMEAREGTQRVMLAGHLQVSETDTRQAIEAAELELIEEIKSFVRAGVSGVGLSLERVENSRQLDHPYGWVVAFIDAGPPRATTH